MGFITNPNLPEKPVGLAVVDGRINGKIEKSLAEKGVKVLKTCAHTSVYAAISHHPDIMLHHLGEEYVIYAPGTSQSLLDALKQLGFVLLEGEKRLGSKYPDNIAYNVARVGKIAFHNFKYTDRVLTNELLKRGVKLINVNQGYSKCSVSIVGEDAIITADRGIAKVAGENGINVLLIEPEENIVLPGLACGFIGGSTGLVDKGKLAVSGDIGTLRSAQNILDFIKQRDMEVFSLSDEMVIDIGSVLPLCEK